MTWKPMSEMPDELRDGREVLCWHRIGCYSVAVSWSKRILLWLPTCYGLGFLDSEFTRYCEITPPTEEGKP